MSSTNDKSRSQRIAFRPRRNGELVDIRDLPFQFRKVKMSKLVYEATDPNLKTDLKIETSSFDQTIIRDTINEYTSNVLFYVAPLIGNGSTNLIEINREDNGYDYEYEQDGLTSITTFRFSFYEGNTLVPDSHFANHTVFIELLFIK